MKNLLRQLDHWAAKAIKFIRPSKHDSPNVLTDNVHLKRNQSVKNKKYSESIVVMPVQYYVTRTGQLMRKPLKRKKNIHKIK